MVAVVTTDSHVAFAAHAAGLSGLVALISKQQRVRVESLDPEVEGAVRAIEVPLVCPASVSPGTVQNLILVVGGRRLVVIRVSAWCREEFVLPVAKLAHIRHRIVGI